MSIMSLLKNDYKFADDYFKEVKKNMNETSEEDIKKVLSKLDQIIEDAKTTGQDTFYNQLMNQKETLQKELKALAKGFYKYISSDIIYYMNDKVRERPIRYASLKEYNRYIPKNVIKILKEVKEQNIFDNFRILYTDLSKHSKKEAEKVYEKSKDPILFGFCSNAINEKNPCKLFFIAEWVDKYCNLTFDKLLQELDDESIKYNTDKNISLGEFIS